ncbi:hypothetical protein SADUNF_Sadunf16G0267800 [Salix dunnii]|uniref:PPIase cyclophilin-type domain-containing protein n=1 Tax=Salix dunnii TaxID=1413687 RepID=A0A835MMW2_9ROSI|nr:hypothetical protein SADUNF_Sadunf16G0267800 [Salix dunnii]
MEEIIAKDDEEEGMMDEDSSNHYAVTHLPNLKALKLSNLPELKSIFHGELICDSLEEILVVNCPKLKRISLSHRNHSNGLTPLRKIQAYPEEWWESVDFYVAIYIYIFVFNLQCACKTLYLLSKINCNLFELETCTESRTHEKQLLAAFKKNSIKKRMKVRFERLKKKSYVIKVLWRKNSPSMCGFMNKITVVAADSNRKIKFGHPSKHKHEVHTDKNSLSEWKRGLHSLLQCIKDQDPDRVSVGLASSLDTVAELELLQAPGLSFLLPQQYLKYPRLTGRGTVEFTIEKVDGSTFSPEAGGEPKKNAKIQVVIDGFSAPLTAGNFAKLVVDGAYNGAKLSFTDQAVLTDNGLDKNSGYSVPLEIMPSGQFEPLYRTSLSVQDGELPVLPLSVYGAVAMAHSEVSEDFSAPYQFFFYLYDKRNAGLGGLSFDEGQFSVFGYTTTGREILSQIKSGDIIQSAKLVEGQGTLDLISRAMGY